MHRNDFNFSKIYVMSRKILHLQGVSKNVDLFSKCNNNCVNCGNLLIFCGYIKVISLSSNDVSQPYGISRGSDVMMTS